MDQVSCSSAVRIGQLNVQSIGNKYAALSNLIKSIMIFSPSLRHDMTLLPVLSYTAALNVRGQETRLSVATNHGGVCLFYTSTYTVCRINVPVYSSAELLAVSAYNSSANCCWSSSTGLAPWRRIRSSLMSSLPWLIDWLSTLSPSLL
jgi:hypothetical protein